MFNVHVDVEYPTDIPEHFDVNGAPEPSCKYPVPANATWSAKRLAQYI